MKAFRFPLEKVLDFRKRRWEAETAELAVLLERCQRLQRQHETAMKALESASQSLHAASCLESGRILQFALVRESGARAIERCRSSLAVVEQEVDQQRVRCIEAKRQYELLLRLRQTRRSIWQREADREEEALSTETYLARRIRDRADQSAGAKSG